MAGFFGLFDYTKEGPGISKNAPRKKSFAVFFEIYGRKFWNLMVAGLLFCLVNIPIFTRGWADAGLTFITRNYSREKHAFVREDFFDTIRKNRRQAFFCGLIDTLVTMLLFFNGWYYLFGMFPGLYALFGQDVSTLTPMEPGIMDYLVMAASTLGYVLFTWMKYYIPMLVITFKLSIKQIYKDAFIFAVAGLKQNILISLVLILIYAVLIAIACFGNMALAVAILLWILLVPAFRSYLIQFTIFPVVKKMMIDPYYRDNPNADKQARRDLNLDVEEEKKPDPEEVVFQDMGETPKAPKEEKDSKKLPKQYSDREMRRFQQATRHNTNDDDDDTI